MWVSPLNMKRIVISLVATLLGLIIGYSGYTYRANHLRLKLELQQTQQQKQELDNKLNETTQEKEQLKKQNDDLQIQLQSKIKQKAILASVTHPVTVVQAPRAVFTGDCASWVAQAGITDTASASVLIQKESGCNPYAVNRSSGACGVAQELPCGKSGCQLGDGACQVAWMNRYIQSRYGSWLAALQFHYRNNWY